MATNDSHIRLAIVGCGRAARDLHLSALRRVAEIDVVALVDSDSQQLNEVGDRFDIAQRCADLDELLNSCSVDAIAICTPPGTHIELAIAVLDAGKHLFIEKPLAPDVADCDRLIARAATSTCKVQVGLNFRRHRLVRQVRAMIEAGEIGNIDLLVSRFTAATRRRLKLPAWRDAQQLGGGVITEMGTHHFDLWRFLLNCEVQEIFAVCQGDEDAAEQSAAVTAKMTNGTNVSAVLSERTFGSNEISLYGCEGWIGVNLYRFDGIERASVMQHAGDARLRASQGLRTIMQLPAAFAGARRGGDFSLMYQDEWRAFAQSILSDAPVPATLQDGRAAVAIAAAARESMQTGKLIQPGSPTHTARAELR